jgi:hypothetical protein
MPTHRLQPLRRAGGLDRNGDAPDLSIIDNREQFQENSHLDPLNRGREIVLGIAIPPMLVSLPTLERRSSSPSWSSLRIARSSCFLPT